MEIKLRTIVQSGNYSHWTTVTFVLLKGYLIFGNEKMISYKIIFLASHYIPRIYLRTGGWTERNELVKYSKETYC